MTHKLPIALLFCSVWLATGCVVVGDPGPDAEDPFEGTFKVTSHTQNEAGCTGPGTDVTGADTFFNLKAENVFGSQILAYRSCTDASTCEENANLFKSFFDEDGKGWGVDITTSSGTGPCALSLVEGPLVETETGLRLETRTHSATLELNAGETCDTDLAKARKAELPCTAIEFLTADKL